MIGAVLKSLREENKLTQKQVADILKIDRSTYAYYETGRTVPDMYTMALLAKIYNITPEYMMSLCYGKAAGNAQVELHSDSRGKIFNGVPPYLSELSKQEQNLILYFRQLKNKDEAVNYIKERCFSDIDKDGDSLSGVNNKSEDK